MLPYPIDMYRIDMFYVLGGNWDPTNKQKKISSVNSENAEFE